MGGIFKSPLIFTPIFKEKIWGGDVLRSALGKNVSPNKPIGESWEISGWGDSQTAVSGGEFSGVALGELFSRDPVGLIGGGGLGRKTFPLLFKFIDAQRNLSIQVHPNSEQARERGWGDCGKTEAWYVVDAKPETQIALGFNRGGVTRAEAEAAVRNGCFESLLNFVPAKRGDTFFIPPGTVHAILGGALIYEVQEESNTTLRLYDWNRKGRLGVERTLHIDDALDIIDFEGGRPLRPEPRVLYANGVYAHESLCGSSKFVISRYRFAKVGEAGIGAIDGFMVMSVTAGSAAVAAGGVRVELGLGQTVLIPAGLDGIRIDGNAGTDVLVTSAS